MSEGCVGDGRQMDRVIALLILLLPCPSPNLPTVDLAEINNYTTSHRAHIVQHQLILWDWSYEHNCYIVVDWKFITSNSDVSRLLSQINYRVFRETATCYDPELLNREVVPVHRRRRISWQ
jgi:hypothetical protein